MQFTTREEYLAAVAAWKLEYASLGAEIRAHREEFKMTQRILSRDGSNFGRNFVAMWEATLKMGGLRQRATELLEDRAASKKASYSAYLQSLLP